MSASTAARRSIRRFSIWVWLVGTIAVMVLTYVQAPALTIDLQTGRIGTGPDRDRVWDQRNPTELTADAGTYSGTGSGYVSLSADAGPSLLSLSRLDSYVDVYMTASSQVEKPVADRDRPRLLGFAFSPGDEVIVVPTGHDTELWIQTEGSWSFTLEPLETTTITDTYSGSGNAYLLYQGDETAARFVHRGTGLFTVDLKGIGTNFEPIMQTDDVNVVETWTSSPSVVIVITADTGEGDWTVTLGTDGTVPNEAPTDDETETK